MRTRAALSDKEERILVQSQLMGLTPSSMVRIGNRLKALEREALARQEIDEECRGYSWGKTDKGWNISTPDQLLCEFTNKSRGKSSWYERNWHYDVKVTKPGTRLKPRHYKQKVMRVRDDWMARLCPGASKELYAMIRWTKNLKWEKPDNV